MDERLERALEFSNYSATINAQKKNIRNRVRQIQTIFYNGGMFIADQETIAFVSVMTSTSNEFTMIDIKETPVEVTDGTDFLDRLISAYTSATNEMSAEFAKFKKSRSISKLLEI